MTKTNRVPCAGCGSMVNPVSRGFCDDCRSPICVLCRVEEDGDGRRCAACADKARPAAAATGEEVRP